MNDRDFAYGYGGFFPMNGNNLGMQYPTSNSYSISQFNDMNDRISRLERQMKRIEQRLVRLETPYSNSNNDSDNNMYMM